MPEEKKDEGKAPPVIDPVKLKKDILESVKEQNAVLLQTVLASKSGESEGKKAADDRAAETPEDLEDFKSEMEEIGIDAEQTKGMIKLMTKFMKKQAPEFEKQVLEKVDRVLFF